MIHSLVKRLIRNHMKTMKEEVNNSRINNPIKWYFLWGVEIDT